MLYMEKKNQQYVRVALATVTIMRDYSGVRRLFRRLAYIYANVRTARKSTCVAASARQEANFMQVRHQTPTPPRICPLFTRRRHIKAAHPSNKVTCN